MMAVSAGNDTVIVNLDKPRTLKFRRKELKMLEKMLNKKISKIDFGDVEVDDISKMINLGLLHATPELTLPETEDLMDEASDSFGAMSMAAMNAFSIAMGGSAKPDEVGEEVKN